MSIKWWIPLLAILACFAPGGFIFLAAVVDRAAVWRWFQTKILGRSDIWFNGSRYMRRWLFGTKSWYGLRVHCIERSDVDRELHDHPFSFVTVILCGGYWEHTANGEHEWHGPGSVLRRSADTLHRIELAPDCPAWTLVFRGPYCREWGFWSAEGWIPWQRFVAQRDGRGVAAGQHSARSSV